LVRQWLAKTARKELPILLPTQATQRLKCESARSGRSRWRGRWQWSRLCWCYRGHLQELACSSKSFVHWVVDQGDDVNELPSRREVINLVDDSDDDAPPVLVASKPRAKMYKAMLPSEVAVLVDNREPVAFSTCWQAGVRCEWETRHIWLLGGLPMHLTLWWHDGR
jgi:hypothetical protein